MSVNPEILQVLMRVLHRARLCNPAGTRAFNTRWCSGLQSLSSDALLERLRAVLATCNDRVIGRCFDHGVFGSVLPCIEVAVAVLRRRGSHRLWVVRRLVRYYEARVENHRHSSDDTEYDDDDASAVLIRRTDAVASSDIVGRANIRVDDRTTGTSSSDNHHPLLDSDAEQRNEWYRARLLSSSDTQDDDTGIRNGQHAADVVEQERVDASESENIPPDANVAEPEHAMESDENDSSDVSSDCAEALLEKFRNARAEMIEDPLSSDETAFQYLQTVLLKRKEKEP